MILRVWRFQDKRISVTDALAHPYLDEGRLRYHSCMCKCCFTTSAGMRQYVVDFEPTAPQPFDDYWERKLTSVQQVKGEWEAEAPAISPAVESLNNGCLLFSKLQRKCTSSSRSNCCRLAGCRYV